MKKLAIIIGFCLLTVTSFAQVGIGNTNPDASSALDITSLDSGLLIPRVSLVNVINGTTPIATPATSLLVWNTNVAVVGGNGVGYYYWNGAWVPLFQSGDNLGDHNATTTLDLNSNDITEVLRLSTLATSDYDKLRVYNNSSYTIGMHGAMTYGYLNDWATTFTMNNAANRGWVWRDEGDAQSDGAMSLTTDGRMTVKQILDIPYTGDVSGTSGAGGIQVGGSLRIDGNEVVTNNNTLLYLQNGNNGDLSVDVSTLYVDASANRVGIGTTAPNATLDARGSAIFNQNGGNYDFRVESDNKAHFLFVDASSDVLFVGGNNTINLGGLPNNGNTMPNSVVVDYVASFYQGSTNGTAVQLGSTEYIMDSGNLQMSVYGSWLPYYPMSATAPFSLGSSAQRWQSVWSINGTIQTSDVKLKKNIKPLNYGLNEILQLETITYQWKESMDNKDKIGFSAQQLLEIIPEVVVTHDYQYADDEKTLIKTKNENLGVYYSDMIPVLVKAIQEQQQLIESQNIKLEKLNRLENEMREIKALLNKN